MNVKRNPYTNRGIARAGAYINSHDGQKELAAAKARIEARKANNGGQKPSK